MASLEKMSQTYYWAGLDPAGKRVRKQRIVAPSTDSAVSSLQRSGAVVVSISPAAKLDLNMSIGSGDIKFDWAQKAEFARRLYQMQQAGVSLAKSLTSMGEEADPRVTAMVDDMAEQVTGGVPLYEAMEGYPKAFDEVFVAYVRAGDESGQMVESLENLSVLLAKRASMASKIKGVMAYPKMVGGTILLLVTGILLFLVPTYAKIYESFGAVLPAPTRALVAMSKNMLPIVSRSTEAAWVRIPIPFTPLALNPLAMLLLAAAAFFGWKYFRKRTADNEQVNVKLNKIGFKSPLMGKLNKTSALFRWASTLAGSLQSGVKQTDAVNLAGDASGSAWIASLSPGFAAAIQSGRPLSEQLAMSPELFPPNVRTMVSTGETTGDVANMLASVAVTLDQDVDAMVEGLSAKIEVALLLVLGGVVGTLLVVLYLPILQLATTASKGMGAG